jgi:hypothetical protein
MAAAAEVAVASSAKLSSSCSVLEVALLVAASLRPVMLLLALTLLPAGWLLLTLSASLCEAPFDAPAPAPAPAGGAEGSGGAWTDRIVGWVRQNSDGCTLMLLL